MDASICALATEFQACFLLRVLFLSAFSCTLSLKRHPQVLAVQREALVTCWMLSVLLKPLAGGIWLLGVGCCGLGMLSG